MTSTKNMICTESPYSSPILKINFVNFDGGKNFIFTHRDILLRAPAFSTLVLELYNNNNTLTACPELMGISFNTFNVIYHYLNTGRYQCLKPLGGTDADRWLHGFETALDVHRSATNINLPSLRDLACVELAKISTNMSLESIFRAMGELKVTLADFPTLATCIKTREMHAKEQRSRQEANTALSTHQPPDPRVQRALEDAKRREIEKFEFKEHRNHMERLGAAMGCFADNPMKLTTAASDRLATTRAFAEAGKAGSEEKLQQTGETSDKERTWAITDEAPLISSRKTRQPLQGRERDDRAVQSRNASSRGGDLSQSVYQLPPTRSHNFTAVNTTKSSTEDTPVADTDGPHPVAPRDENTVSDDWDILSPTEVSEEEDFDLRSLAISRLNASNKRKSDTAKDNDKQ
ncbi:hypothetical protein FAVG1_07967 [Fusarium avenaceum]|nr:hypothetical protein FAVG1_07967 [Fusarium avenaceum]